MEKLRSRPNPLSSLHGTVAGRLHKPHRCVLFPACKSHRGHRVSTKSRSAPVTEPSLPLEAHVVWGLEHEADDGDGDSAKGNPAPADCDFQPCTDTRVAAMRPLQTATAWGLESESSSEEEDTDSGDESSSLKHLLPFHVHMVDNVAELLNDVWLTAPEPQTSRETEREERSSLPSLAKLYAARSIRPLHQAKVKKRHKARTTETEPTRIRLVPAGGMKKKKNGKVRGSRKASRPAHFQTENVASVVTDENLVSLVNKVPRGMARCWGFFDQPWLVEARSPFERSPRNQVSGLRPGETAGSGNISVDCTDPLSTKPSPGTGTQLTAKASTAACPVTDFAVLPSATGSWVGKGWPDAPAPSDGLIDPDFLSRDWRADFGHLDVFGSPPFLGSDLMPGGIATPLVPPPASQLPVEIDEVAAEADLPLPQGTAKKPSTTDAESCPRSPSPHVEVAEVASGLANWPIRGQSRADPKSPSLLDPAAPEVPNTAEYATSSKQRHEGPPQEVEGGRVVSKPHLTIKMGPLVGKLAYNARKAGGSNRGTGSTSSASHGTCTTVPYGNANAFLEMHTATDNDSDLENYKIVQVPRGAANFGNFPADPSVRVCRVPLTPCKAETAPGPAPCPNRVQQLPRPKVSLGRAGRPVPKATQQQPHPLYRVVTPPKPRPLVVNAEANAQKATAKWILDLKNAAAAGSDGLGWLETEEGLTLSRFLKFHNEVVAKREQSDADADAARKMFLREHIFTVKHHKHAPVPLLQDREFHNEAVEMIAKVRQFKFLKDLELIFGVSAYSSLFLYAKGFANAQSMKRATAKQLEVAGISKKASARILEYFETRNGV